MLNEKKMSKAIVELLASDKEESEVGIDCDLDDYTYINGADSSELYEELQRRFQYVHEYQISSVGIEYKPFKYKGDKLFKKRAVMLHSEYEEYNYDIATQERDVEIWLTEDGEFYEVECIYIQYGYEDVYYMTEYRKIRNRVKEWADVGFPIDNLLVSLSDIVCGKAIGR